MTINAITAANDILAGINRDLANREGFTMTRGQLARRIDDYFEGINDDAALECFLLLTAPGVIRCFRPDPADIHFTL